MTCCHYFSELRRKHERKRSRLLAIIQGSINVSFSDKKKLIPSKYIHGTFKNKFNSDSDMISVTSSISASESDNGDDDNNDENTVGNIDTSSKNMADESESSKGPSNEKCSSNGKIKNQRVPSSQERANSVQGRKICHERERGLYITAPLILPPTPSYYKPPQYYATTLSTDKSDDVPKNTDQDEKFPAENNMLSSKVTFQKRAVSLGYSNGTKDCKKVVYRFMSLIFWNWRMFSKRHKDVRRLGQFLKSCTKLRSLSKVFYQWLVRSSALAHRQSTWILPCQKQVPFYSEQSLDTNENDLISDRKVTWDSPGMTHCINKISMGYAPQTAARNGNTLNLLNPSIHQKELPIASSSCNGICEQERGQQLEELLVKNFTEPYPLRTTIANERPSAVPLMLRKTSLHKAASGGNLGQSITGTRVQSKHSCNNVYEGGKFFLGRDNIQCSNIVSNFEM